MNETPPSFWKRPWRGPGRTFAWYGLATLGAFVALFVIGLLTQDTFGAPELFGLAFVGSILLAAFMFVAVLFFRWVACWQNLRRLLFAVVLLITLIALAYAEENWRGKHAWQTYRQQLEAKGEKLSLADLVPPPVPDDQNLALAPLLKPVMDFSHTPTGVVWHDTNGVARLQAISADLQPARSTNKDLTLGAFEKGGFADLSAWAGFYRGNTNYPQADPTAPPADVVLVALSKCAPDLKDLADAAAARPLSRFPIQYSHEPNWGILLPHLARMKGLSTLLSVHATASLAAGRSADAFNDLQLGLRFSDSIRNEPILIDHLVRIAVLHIDLQILREGLLRHAWSDAQLSQLQAQLAAIDILAEYQLAMRGERACSVGAVDFLRRTRGGGGDDPFDSVPNPSFHLAPSGWFYQNMLTIARLDEQFLLRCVDPQAHRVYPDIARAGRAAIDRLSFAPYNYFAKYLLPALDNACKKSARTQTFVDAARLACALERFRLASGKLPDSLDALVPAYLNALPTDVIDGQPLRYRVQPDGLYLLYSVGWNKTDDQGELAWNTDDPKKLDPDQGDWTWQMPATNQTLAGTSP